MKYQTITLITSIIFLSCSQFVLASSCVDLIKKENFYEAANVCTDLAEKGDKNAQFALAVLYYQGNGVMNDMTLAQKWMRKSAEQNHNQAQYNLGIMLANGHGSSVDLIEAYAWLNISAGNGYSAASDSANQLGEELSSKEKKLAIEKIQQLKGELKL